VDRINFTDFGNPIQFTPLSKPIPYIGGEYDHEFYISFNANVGIEHEVYTFATQPGAFYYIRSASFFDPALFLFDRDENVIEYDDDSNSEYGTDYIYYYADDRERVYVYTGWDQGIANGHRYAILDILVDLPETGDPTAIEGTSGSDEIIGTDEDDVIIGYEGDDYINGGLGVDTARFSGSSNSYTITIDSSAVKIIDRTPGNITGIDTLEDIEILEFSGDEKLISLEIISGITKVSEEDVLNIVELYISYFNRAPDAIGLNFWITQFSNGVEINEIARLFNTQDEVRSLYPEGTSNKDFVAKIYDNILGRTPDEDGFNFWVSALDSGAVPRDQFILNILQGVRSEIKAENGEEFVAQKIADQKYLEDKVDIGAYYSLILGLSNVDSASIAMSMYSGDNESLSATREYINSIYEDYTHPRTGEFIIEVVGIINDPFSDIA
jgi:hypothetical protein